MIATSLQETQCNYIPGQELVTLYLYAKKAYANTNAMNYKNLRPLCQDLPQT